MRLGSTICAAEKMAAVPISSATARRSRLVAIILRTHFIYFNDTFIGLEDLCMSFFRSTNSDCKSKNITIRADRKND